MLHSIYFNYRVLLISIAAVLLFVVYFNVQQTRLAKKSRNYATANKNKSYTSPEDSLVYTPDFGRVNYEFLACKNYKQSCNDLYAKLRYPDKSLVMSMPPKEIPFDMIDEFTQHGAMPIRKYFYSNEAYKDAQQKVVFNNSSLVSNVTNGTIANETASQIEQVDMAQIKKWKRRFRSGKNMAYKSKLLRKAMRKYAKDDIKNKTAIVVGTQELWLEAMLDGFNASKILTLDYTRKSYPKNQTKFEWWHVNDFLDSLIAQNIDDNTELYDVAVSYSSIEHSGLGRYGDPINPNGDLDAMKQVHCLLRPGSKFFFGVPTVENDRDIGFIDFNLHRYYGKLRLDAMFTGWKLLEKTKRENHHTTFVLEKLDLCKE